MKVETKECSDKHKHIIDYLQTTCREELLRLDAVRKECYENITFKRGKELHDSSNWFLYSGYTNGYKFGVYTLLLNYSDGTQPCHIVIEDLMCSSNDIVANVTSGISHLSILCKDILINSAQHLCFFTIDSTPFLLATYD